MRHYWNSIEEANNAARNRAKEYRKAVDYIPAIVKALKEFDKKVYNCRLDKAIQAATENRVYCERSSYYFQIYTYPEHNYSHHITLASIKPDDFIDGKRIPADKLIESTRHYRESLLSKAYNIESNIEQMAQVTAYIKQTADKLEQYCRTFDDDLRDIYDIPYVVRLD